MHEPNITLIAEEKFLALQLIKPNKRAFPPLDAFTEYRRPLAEMILNADEKHFDSPDWFYHEFELMGLNENEETDMYLLLSYLTDVAMRIELTALHTRTPIPDAQYYADILKEGFLRDRALKLSQSMQIDLMSGMTLENVLSKSIQAMASIGKELIA
jgi:hypothetical protein